MLTVVYSYVHVCAGTFLQMSVSWQLALINWGHNWLGSLMLPKCREKAVKIVTTCLPGFVCATTARLIYLFLRNTLIHFTMFARGGRKQHLAVWNLRWENWLSGCFICSSPSVHHCFPVGGFRHMHALPQEPHCLFCVPELCWGHLVYGSCYPPVDWAFQGRTWPLPYRAEHPQIHLR